MAGDLFGQPLGTARLPLNYRFWLHLQHPNSTAGSSCWSAGNRLYRLDAVSSKAATPKSSSSNRNALTDHLSPQRDQHNSRNKPQTWKPTIVPERGYPLRGLYEVHLVLRTTAHAAAEQPSCQGTAGRNRPVIPDACTHCPYRGLGASCGCGCRKRTFLGAVLAVELTPTRPSGEASRLQAPQNAHVRLVIWIGSYSFPGDSSGLQMFDVQGCPCCVALDTLLHLELPIDGAETIACLFLVGAEQIDGIESLEEL